MQVAPFSLWLSIFQLAFPLPQWLRLVIVLVCGGLIVVRAIGVERALRASGETAVAALIRAIRVAFVGAVAVTHG